MSSRAARLVLAALLLPACSGDINDGSTNPAVTRRVSLSAAGTEANRACENPDVSADGRYVVFESAAGNLVPGDLNGKVDVFRKDLATGEILLVSVGSTGEQGDGDSTNPSISDDGSCVAFQSLATNLAATDGNALPDVFVRRIEAAETLHVSQAAAGGPPTGVFEVVSLSPRISPDGGFVAFVSTGEDLDAANPNFEQDTQVFLHDLSSATNSLLSLTPDGFPSQGIVGACDVSEGGLFVVFASTAADLVADDINGAEDVFLCDLQGGSVERLSREHASDPDATDDGENANGGSRAPRITPDGLVVVFESDAPDLAPGDGNGETDVFRLDRSTGEILRVSRSLAGSDPANASSDAAVSRDGRFVAYRSLAANLVEADTNNQADHFWHDAGRGVGYRVSVRTGGAQTFLPSSGRPALTADGRFVVFASEGPDLAVGDLNGVPDVFIRGPLY